MSTYIWFKAYSTGIVSATGSPKSTLRQHEQRDTKLTKKVYGVAGDPLEVLDQNITARNH